ncbi:putative serine/threonine-protein kinase PBL28 isoform X1 [Senna tora]|uniref:non-specific serine/threonine protein kinase n=1 Tax=Senna tora TaxID=362788 RepID=A0A834SLI0_9FABA|nr:putative serine/threonine-protein kinase PBL28 isoform X1 [Senna tora]
MRLLFWQQLPLLIVIPLLYPNKFCNKLYAEALFSFKSSHRSPQQVLCSIAKYPCERACLHCHELKDPCAFSLGIPARIDGTNDVPTLTPVQEAQVKRHEGTRVAAIVGGVVAAFLVVVILVIVYVCLMRVKRFIRQTSEAASSIPSPTVELGMSNNSQNIRRFAILELEQATRNFSESNLIGEGRFGLVYKGLLQDGSIVAIKRRQYDLTQNFIPQVKQIADIHHMHLVKIIGYYEDSHQQLLVQEYLPNGNVGNHLYDSEGLPIGRLDMWRRLSIALGASKGLAYLHSWVPPLVHTHFRTRNVLVDESFTAKVSDYGFYRLQTNSDHAGSSSSSNIDCFLDPEMNLSQEFSEKSDVYSFGVFLQELISGREAHIGNVQVIQVLLLYTLSGTSSNELEEFVDVTLGSHEKGAARKVMKLALLCLGGSVRRPSMDQIVGELERIQSEFGALHSNNNHDFGVVTLTLGSDLFK